MDSLHYTNNAPEFYNNHFGEVFKQGKVRLDEFVKVVETVMIKLLPLTTSEGETKDPIYPNKIILEMSDTD